MSTTTTTIDKVEPNVVYMLFGSHLYGLDTPDSDEDYKGIYIPKLHELLLHTYPKTMKESSGAAHEKNKAGDFDNEVISLPRFVEMGIAGETMVLDMLHCNEPLIDSPVWQSLVQHRTRFYSKNLKAFVGYVKRQASKYGIKGSRLADVRAAIDQLNRLTNVKFGKDIKLSQIWGSLYTGDFAKKIEKNVASQPDPQHFYEVNGKLFQSTNNAAYVANQLVAMYAAYGARAKLAEKNEGVDWKAISHALRAAYQARDIYLLGDYKYPLAETDFLLDVKNGKLDYKSCVGPVLEELVDEVTALCDSSDMRDKVDRKFWDEWLLMVYEAEYPKALKLEREEGVIL